MNNKDFQVQIELTAAYIAKHALIQPKVAIVLGSGLGTFTNHAFDAPPQIFNYKDIPNFPQTSVHGHRGALFVGMIRSKPVICFSGRFHSYEGHDSRILTLLPRIASQLGCKAFILTNAAGGTLKGMQTGCLMIIKQHSSTVRFNPLYGYEGDFSIESTSNLKEFIQQLSQSTYPITVSSDDIYSEEMQRIAQEIVTKDEFIQKTKFTFQNIEREIVLHSGIYSWNSGPNYESHSETAFAVDNIPGAVGMSSVHEALMARALGMHVFGMSIITNLASGLSDEVICHEDVQVIGSKVSLAVNEVILEIIEKTDFDQLKKVEKLVDVKNNNNELVQVNEKAPTQEEVKTFAKHFKNINKVVMYSGSKFQTYQQDDILFVQIRKSESTFNILSVIDSCVLHKIDQILVVDQSLPLGTQIHCSNVINLTGNHVTFYDQATQQQNQKSKVLAVFDGIEEPSTSTYFKNLQNYVKADFLTNKVSALPAVHAHLSGLDLFYVSTDMLHQKFISNHPASVQRRTDIPKFNLFSVKQPSYEAAEALFKTLPPFKNVVILDFISSNYTANLAKMISKSTKLSDNLYIESDILYITLPALNQNSDFEQQSALLRILKFASPKIIYLCNAAHGAFIVKDVINSAAINPLRGENDDRFGPRFPDLSEVKTATNYLNLDKKVAVLTLEPFVRCACREELVSEGGCMGVLVLCQQKSNFDCVVGSIEVLTEVLKEFLGLKE
ncbi:Nucleoside ribosyltransferase / Purine nucleoside phosphorylase [Spironucleus salmonicida]|uniref:purine-nucleoside phosphorylase n=1 Tax=Spironucleus salmonicida TaxID=348837 RepID=V6LDX5_9EUKA|nr:Nucleoside ribosyltransferase / Purine nucleoside phosphorylase [Spironucleus salmonicida]|eukprot:EST42483.1 Purine nucleoside phosphorylase [Spironucleus salmonicida]